MRRGTWILATCGLVGLALSAGVADDGFGGRPGPGAPGARSLPRPSDVRPGLPAEERSAESPSTRSEDASGGRGEQVPARYIRREETYGARGASSPTDSSPPVRNYYRELFGSDEEPAAPAESGRRIPDSGAIQPASAEDDTPASRIIRADFSRSPGQAERDRIELIRAEKPEARGAALPDKRGAGLQPASTAPSETGRRTATAPAAPPRSPSVTETRGVAPSRAPAESRIAVASDLFKAGSDDPQSPTVSLRWIKQSSINVGQECACDLVVSNTSQVAARNVTVEAYFPNSVRLTSAQPRPSVETDYLAWNFPTLNAGQEQTIRIRMIPSQRGELTTTAFVRFTGAASSVFEVEEPMLRIAVKGPKEVMLGDPASQIIEVSNPGSGVAENVTVEAVLPAGLEHPRGERLAMNVGSLGPGETRMVRLALAAAKGGQHVVQIEARGEANLRQQAEAPIMVIAPSLKVAVDGPGLRYIGRNAVYEVTVTNDGTAVSNNVRVAHRVPEGFEFVRADRGGKHDSSKRSVEWFLGRLEPGQSAPLKVELTAAKLGRHVHQAVAISEHGSASESRLETQVDGTSSLVLDIVDLNDPVEVGVETAYEVRVRNDGSKGATNVGITCELPAGVELLSAEGPVDHMTEKNLVVFRSLKSLEPGETVLYRVHVRGVQEGSHRFRARLASDSIQEPLIFEELTKFYAE